MLDAWPMLVHCGVYHSCDPLDGQAGGLFAG